MGFALFGLLVRLCIGFALNWARVERKFFACQIHYSGFRTRGTNKPIWTYKDERRCRSRMPTGLQKKKKDKEWKHKSIFSH